MSTYITVTSGTGALVNRVKQVQQANREAQLQQQQDNALALQAAREITLQQATDVPVGGNPDVQVVRRPAAQRTGYRWFLWSANWLAPAQAVSVGERIYRYIESKNLRFHLSKQSDAIDALPDPSLQDAQGTYVYDASFGLTSAECANLPFIGRNGGEFAGASSGGGSFYFTQAPVVSSRRGIIFGVQRHSISYTNTPWTRNSFGPESSNGVTRRYLYIYFRLDTKTGVLSLRTATETYNTSSPTPSDVLPYVEGGSVWTQNYSANGFSDDPSLAVRALGYYGDYHVANGRAHFLRLKPPGSTGLFLRLSSISARSIWDKGEQLQWLSFAMSETDPSAIKAALDAMQSETPTGSYQVKPAFAKQSDVDSYNALSLGVHDLMLPTGELQFWNPTGPFIYPLMANYN